MDDSTSAGVLSEHFFLTGALTDEEMIHMATKDHRSPPQFSSKAYTVSEATRSDIEAIVCIGGCEDAAPLTADSVANRMDAFPEGVKVVRDVLTGKCVGYLFAEIWEFKCSREASDFGCRNDLSDMHDNSGTELHVSSIAIAEEYRDLGLSDFLLTTSIISLRLAFPRVRSIVAVANPKCRTTKLFFSKRRFIVVDSLPGFKGSKALSRDTALVMRKFFGAADSLSFRSLDASPIFKHDFALA